MSLLSFIVVAVVLGIGWQRLRALEARLDRLEAGATPIDDVEPAAPAVQPPSASSAAPATGGWRASR